ncbi:MAG: L-aspartate oxidase [Candidatus Gracilibacteria bacterium]|jgi:L-aspartate oxidase
MKEKIFDFIVVGSGLAGLNTAIQASKRGTVLLITKKGLSDANTFYAQGGIATVLKELNKKDSFKKHVEDTLIAGNFHNNKKAVEFIIKKGPLAIKQLINLGVAFSKNAEGDLALHREGGHREKRIIHSGDYTGKAIEETLIKTAKQNKKITISEKTFAKDLLIKNKTCYGIQVIYKNKIRNYFGKKIILATGGIGQIYAKTTNPVIATGDGLAMALHAQCKLKDLEFIQFHPTALDEKKNPIFLLSEALRGSGAIILNHKKERFMMKYHPMAELAPRDIVSRAIYKEAKKGKIYLQMNVKGANKEFPQISHYLKETGYNLEKDLISITPVAHFSCGGIETDLKGQTSIKNLFAFGEVAYTGLHGANRLASNSLLEAIVMSNEILKTLLNTSVKTSYPYFATPTLTTQKSSNLKNIKENLKKIMWNNVGIIREEKKLIKAINGINKLMQGLPKIKTKEYFETKNMLEVALAITKSALKRKKSLGTHFRIN